MDMEVHIIYEWDIHTHTLYTPVPPRKSNQFSVDPIRFKI